MKEKYFPTLLADFIYAILAGLAIGLDGAVFLAIDNKILGALFFTVGLFTVCVNGFNLFTGKVGYTWGQPPSYLLFLLVVWLGNLLGTCTVAALLNMTRLSSAFTEKAGNIAAVKLADGALSILCLLFFVIY